MRRLVLFLLACCISAPAATYYVSNSGTDAPGCTTAATACKTLAYVDGIGLQPGDSVLLQRGGTWNEVLIPPASGVSGNPITYDAYGSGAAPVLTPVIDLSSATWSHNSGNIYTTTLNTPISSPQIYNLRMRNVWGKRRTANPACTTAGVIQGYGDFCVVYPTLYVYSPNGTLPSAYYGTITPVVSQAAGLAVVSIVNKSWLVFQHIKIQNFDYLGVSVSGASDNLVFANMESDGTVPYGTTPHGFYVNASSGHGVNVQFLNDDAGLNYDGFRVDSAGSVSVTNCRGYANRDAGLRDNTTFSNAVTYSYSHFYGNNVAQLPTTDVIGGIVGSGNVALVCGGAAALPTGMCSSMAAPVVANVATYPARFSFTVDDVGSSPGTEAYINSFLSTFSSRPGVKFNAAIVPSYAGLNGENAVDWASVNSWYASGNEIDSHSWSHQYYTTTGTPSGACTPSSCPNAPALKIQYTGSGTAATMTVSGTTLSTNVTGAPADNISINLANAPYNQMGKTGSGGWGLANYLNTFPHYSVVIDTDAGVPMVRPNTHTMNLAGTTGSAISISGQDIKTAPFVWVYDQALLLADEMAASKSAIQSNVPGLVESVYVYPDGIEDTTSEAAAVAAGYSVGRGSLAMKGQDNSTGSANSFYSNGVNVQNITSLAVIPIHGMAQGQVNQIAASLVFRARAWGVPYALFTHYNSRGDNTPDISNTELEWLLDAIQANGGVWMTNTALGNAISAPPAATAISGSTRFVQNPSGSALNLAVAQANSPTVGQGLATAYPVDLNGMDRSRLGAWDIGASSYLSQRYGGAGGTGSTRIGGWAPQQSVTLPLNWVNSNEWIGTTTNAIGFPASGSGGSWSCGATNYGPYTAGSQASLQQAINDAEACRAANGSGTQITIPAGALFSGSSGLTLPQTAGDTSSNFIVLQSSTPLPVGRTVCSHGIQDNVPASTQPGIRNLLCDGTQMSYQLGTTVTTVSGAFTLANGTNTNTSAYDDVASMYTIECTTSGCNDIISGAFDSNNVGPHHYAILNGEFRPLASLAAQTGPIKIGTAGETVPSQRPSHIHIAYSFVHGNWSDAPVSGGVATGSPTGNGSMANAVALSSCVYCSIAYSYFDQVIRPGSEGHVIYLGFFDQIKLVHNWVEGASSGLFAGGFSNTVPLTGFGSDVEDRGNRYTYPYSWKLAYAAGFCVNGLSCSGNNYVRKNTHEMKIGNGTVDDGNIYENSDYSGGQTVSVSWKTDNCSTTACENYWIRQQNLTQTNSIVRNGCQGFSWGYRAPNAPANGGGVTPPTELANFSNNLTYAVGSSSPGCGGVSPEMGFRVNQLGVTTWPASCTRDATGSIATCTLTGAIGRNQSDFNVGIDPVSMSACTDMSFNTVSTAMGPLALPGTLPAGLTVVYASSGTPNASTSGCTLSNLQGWPAYLNHNHNSEFLTNPDTSATSPYSTATNAPPYQLARYMTFTNDVFVGGGLTGNWQEGTRTETKSFDPATEVVHDILFPGRDQNAWCPGHQNGGPGGMATCYTEYSDTHVASLPATLYGTPTDYCAGNDPTTENCVGVVGAMSKSAFPSTLLDWHDYRLCHGEAVCNGKTSFYAAGQAHDGSDGTDLGFVPLAIDAAQTSSRYCNGGVCGYPDF